MHRFAASPDPPVPTNPHDPFVSRQRLTVSLAHLTLFAKHAPLWSAAAAPRVQDGFATGASQMLVLDTRRSLFLGARAVGKVRF